MMVSVDRRPTNHRGVHYSETFGVHSGVRLCNGLRAEATEEDYWEASVETRESAVSESLTGPYSSRKRKLGESATAWRAGGEERPGRAGRGKNLEEVER